MIKHIQAQDIQVGDQSEGCTAQGRRLEGDWVEIVWEDATGATARLRYAPTDVVKVAEEKSAIAQAVAQIVAIARAGIDLTGMPLLEALDHAVRYAKDDADRARTRTGYWAREITSREIEDALFLGSVANDILDGTVERPSVGNVRAYAIYRLSLEA